MAHIPLSDGEWKLMNQLWGKSPATITQLTERLVAQLVHALAPETGWSKHTIITMLSRLEKKGAVAHRENGRAKEFWPVLDQADACRRETRSFLDRLYGGSLGLMVSTLVGTEALTPDDVEELEELLQRAKEAKRHDESQ